MLQKRQNTLYFPNWNTEAKYVTVLLATMKLSLALIMAASANKAERKAERTERRLRQDKRQMFTPERFVYQL